MRKLLSIISLALFSSVMIATAAPSFAGAATTPDNSPTCGGAKFLTMPAWYKGVAAKDANGDCNVSVEAAGGDLKTFIWKIAFNIVEIMLNIVAYVSAAFVIVGGFKYLTSAGSPDGNVKGRKTILNAVVGLIISIMSIGIVNLITSRL